MHHKVHEEITKHVHRLHLLLKEKQRLQDKLDSILKEEKDIAFQLNCLYGNQPIQEKAQRINEELGRIKKMSKRIKSDNAKNRWKNLPPKERERRKNILRINLAKAREVKQQNKRLLEEAVRSI